MKTSVKFPPGPKNLFPAQLFISVSRDPIRFVGKYFGRYGDVFHITYPTGHAYIVKDPHWIHEVLVVQAKNFKKSLGYERMKLLFGEGLLTSEGAFHRRQRRLSQPAFHRQRIASYGPIMVEHTERLLRGWTVGKRFELNREMMKLTLTVAAKTLFNLDLESETQRIGASLSTMMELFLKRLFLFGDLYLSLPLPGAFRLRKAKADLDRIIYKAIHERKALAEDQGDLLSMLVKSQDLESGGSAMSDQQLRDELITQLLAGHETTANALTWTWYLLSQHPQVEAKMHQEIESVLHGNAPTVEILPKLSYTRNVFAEALRLFPPAYTIGRRAMNECRIGDYVIPKGAQIIMSQYYTHRDPKYFADPQQFRPERWTPDFEKSLAGGVYFPFGEGSRQCIGEEFAWMEGILVLATIARNWRIRVVPGHPIALQPSITLRPKYGIEVVAEQVREHSSIKGSVRPAHNRPSLQ